MSSAVFLPALSLIILSGISWGPRKNLGSIIPVSINFVREVLTVPSLVLGVGTLPATAAGVVVSNFPELINSLILGLAA